MTAERSAWEEKVLATFFDGERLSFGTEAFYDGGYPFVTGLCSCF